MNTIAVITSIHQPTPAVDCLATLLPDRVLVVADEKTPKDWNCSGARFLSTEAQAKLPLKLAPCLNHYARKNIGYLQAMLLGADCIYDTDDDNVPFDHWKERDKLCEPHDFASVNGWLNVYSLFSPVRPLWPRGLPLSEIRSPRPVSFTSVAEPLVCPIQQGLANGDPDVDAIWRLTASSTPIQFSYEKSVVLNYGTWCPFNSQTTWWFPEAFPLLYLPQTAPFRMTDIWRSFIAQRCLWAGGLGHVAFHSPAEVLQERNPHNLMNDFADEIRGYLENEHIVEILSDLPLEPDPSLDGTLRNLRACYAALDLDLRREELWYVDAWIEDVRRMLAKSSWDR